jgi:hypothetical protein
MMAWQDTVKYGGRKWNMGASGCPFANLIRMKLSPNVAKVCAERPPPDGEARAGNAESRGKSTATTTACYRGRQAHSALLAEGDVGREDSSGVLGKAHGLGGAMKSQVHVGHDLYSLKI